MRSRSLMILAVAGSILLAAYPQLRGREFVPPSPAELEETHNLTGVHVNSQSAFIEMQNSANGLVPAYIFLGDLDSGRYYQIVVKGEKAGLYRVIDGSARLVSRLNPGRLEPPFILSRSNGSVRIYSSGTLKDKIALSDEPVSVVSAWDRVLTGERPRFRVQEVEPVRLDDNFMRTRIGGDDGWDIRSGNWRIMRQSAEGTAPNPYSLRARGEDDIAGLMRTGYEFWNNYRLGLSINPEVDSAMGFAFACDRDFTRYLALIRHDDNEARAELLRVGDDGNNERLISRRLGYMADRWTRIELDVTEGKPVRMFIDGKPVIEAHISEALFGQVGVYVEGEGGYLDDFSARGLDSEKPQERMVPVVQKSDTFEEKYWFERDNRDEYLHRWASDTDAWDGSRIELDEESLSGYINSTTLFGDFRAELPDADEAWLVALMEPDDKPVFHRHVEPSDSAVILERKGDYLYLEGERVERLESSAPVRVGVFSAGRSWPLSNQPQIFAENIRMDYFESAPTRWLRVSGEWELTTRWQCEQKWSFFGGIGVSDAILLSKESYEGDQVHEFYYAMKDIFNREYDGRRYGRYDVNFSFCSDGKNLNSGYTFLYGGKNNSASILMKGDRIVAWNEKARFPLYTGRHSVNDLHTLWWRFRIEKIGRRIRITQDDNVIFDWVDTEIDAPDRGHVAFWTHRNGIVYARAKSTAVKIHEGYDYHLQPRGLTAANGWRSMEPHRTRLENVAEPNGADNTENGPNVTNVRVINRFGGGTFAAMWEIDDEINLSETPILEIPFRAGEGAMVNLHVVASRRSAVFKINAPVEETYRGLTPRAPSPASWRNFSTGPMSSPQIEDASCYDPESGLVRIDLEEEIKRRYSRMDEPMLTGLIIGNTSNSDYLMAGFGGNSSDSWYELGEPRFLPRESD